MKDRARISMFPVEGADKNSHVCKNRAENSTEYKKQGQNPKIRKDEVKIPMCIKIGPEL